MPSIMSSIGLNASAFYSSAQAVQKGVSNLGASFKSHLGSKLSSVISWTSIEQGAMAMLELGGKIQDVSNKLGMSTTEVQQWDFALKQNGSSIEAAIPFFQKLSQAREKALEGNSDAINDFKALGVSIDMLKTGRVSDIASVIAEGFQLGDPQQLIAPLVAVGGKGALSMAAAFRDGLAEALGEAPVISQESIEALDRAADKISKLKAELAAAFAPLVAGAASGFELLQDAAGTAMSAFMGLFNGLGWKGGVEAYTAQMDARDKEAKEKADRLAQGNKGAFDPEAAMEKAAEKEKELAEKADRDKEKERLKAIRDAEKQKKEERQLDQTVKREAEKEMSDATKLAERKDSGAQLGYAGTFGLAAGPEVAAMNATISSESHLREIRDHIVKKRNELGTGTEAGSEIYG